MDSGNKLQVPGTAALDWEWQNVGAVFSDTRPHVNRAVSARCNFTVRQGFDVGESVAYGRVLEGLGDMGINLRSKHFGFSLCASNLTYKEGTDAPLRAQALLGADQLASLRLVVTQQFAPDALAAVSYDFKQRKPQLALAWSGQTFTERATLLVRADPVDRTLRLGAAVSFPGPEWRVDVIDTDDGRVEAPRDDGARHAVFVEHEARPGALLGPTTAGARLDLGRLLNLVADYVDYNVVTRVPAVLWRIPLSQRLYNLLVPAEDEQQERHHIRGWELEAMHTFGSSGPALGLVKRAGHASLAARYSLADSTASLQLHALGLSVGAALTRTGDGWRAPALTLSIQPMAFL